MSCVGPAWNDDVDVRTAGRISIARLQRGTPLGAAQMFRLKHCEATGITKSKTSKSYCHNVVNVLATPTALQSDQDSNEHAFFAAQAATTQAGFCCRQQNLPSLSSL